MPTIQSKLTIDAYLKDISPEVHVVNSQRLSQENIEAYADRFSEGLVAPPVLIIPQKPHNGRSRIFVLDGFHRLEAAKKAEMKTIKAWVVSQASIDRLVRREFDGRFPIWFCDMDDFILCDGEPYRRPRTDGPGRREDEIAGDTDWSSDDDLVTIEGDSGQDEM